MAAIEHPHQLANDDQVADFTIGLICAFVMLLSLVAYAVALTRA